MPAGDLVQEDWQAEVRGVLLGKGAPTFRIRKGGWPDIYADAVKTADLELLGDGDYPGVDFTAAKVLVWGFIIYGTQSAMQAAIDTFRSTVWTLGDDTRLDFQLGGVHAYLMGRTRRILVDERRRRSGAIEIDAEFKASDPTITVVS